VAAINIYDAGQVNDGYLIAKEKARRKCSSSLSFLSFVNRKINGFFNDISILLLLRIHEPIK
jgi:hypothetical protein